MKNQSANSEHNKLPPEQSDLEFSTEELEPKYFTTLEIIEKLIEYTDAIGINDNLFEKARSFISILSQRLSINPMQTVLFAVLFSKYNVPSLDNNDLAQLLKCTPIKLLHYMNDLEELQRTGLIACRTRNSDVSYRIPMEVVNTLRKEDVFIRETNQNITIDELFGIFEELFDRISEDEITIKVLGEELLSLIEKNMHLVFCQKIMSYKFSSENIILLLCFCHLYINNGDDNIGFHDFKFLFEKRSKGRLVNRQFREGDHVLMDSKFIENTNNDGFVNRDSYKLSDNAKKELLVELDPNDIKVRRKKGLVLWETLEQKKMFYNKKESQSIKRLISLLNDENYKAIQGRLSESGMRKGFACLFSGAPGTGKTETVYQIAKATERNLMMVDISCIKGMYVGETEKTIKAVFDNYRNAVSNSERAPILVFNEADGIIGKRIEFTNSSRSVERMENTMQNIILQEMESLEGILIATTNLTRNMDKAFERRFLYKIEFTKPDIEFRQSIWQSMLPALSDTEAHKLADSFDFSGGQIENIARKAMVESVLTGAKPGLDTLESFCRDEILESDAGVRIGFTV